MSKRELIAIPMGDPAGIGPEITAKALANKKIYEMCKPVVIGDAEVFEKAIQIVEKDLNLNVISKLSNVTMGRNMLMAPLNNSLINMAYFIVFHVHIHLHKMERPRDKSNH